MPRFTLTDEQVAEVVDVLASEIDTLRTVMNHVQANGPTEVEFKHRESVLLEIMEILEDA